MTKKLARVSNNNITELKYLVKNYLTECPIRLSSKSFKDELMVFFQEKGIKNIYDIKVSKTMVTFYFDIDGLIGTSIWITKEVFND